MTSGVLAALAGALGGLGDGLQLQQQLKARDAQLKLAQDEAQARRRSEVLQALQVRDSLGLVRAPEYQGSIGKMLRETPSVGETGTALGSVVSALKPVAGQLALPQERPDRVALQDPMSGRSEEFVLDPTQSARARDFDRQRTAAREEYGMRRSDALSDQQAAQSQQTAERERANRAAFATMQALYPAHALAKGEYRPEVDYGTIGATVGKTEAERAEFQRRITLQDRAFGQQRTLAAMKPDGEDPSKATDGQRKTAAYLELARSVMPIMDAAPTPSRGQQVLSRIGFNEALNEQQQKIQQAGMVLADAYIRFTSGANAPEAEVQRTAAMLTPMPGDSEGVRAQKQATRQSVLRAMEIGAGRAAASVTPAAPSDGVGRPVPVNPYR